MDEAMLTIDCDECALDRSTACGDCVVSFLVGHQRDEALVIDAGEARALRLLQGAGLVPALLHHRRVG